MRPNRKSLFRPTHAIEVQIEEFLDKVSEVGILFQDGVRRYADTGLDDRLEEAFGHISAVEHRCDELRHSVETTLYTEMLLPDTRGDVLNLLDDLDRLVDRMKSDFQILTIEQPEIPETLRDDLKELAATVVRSVEALVLASRTYFRDPGGVRDHLHKVGFHEHEADSIATRLSTLIFDMDLPLERKRHLRSVVQAVDRLADAAEDAGDRLAIYAVKRSL